MNNPQVPPRFSGYFSGGKTGAGSVRPAAEKYLEPTGGGGTLVQGRGAETWVGLPAERDTIPYNLTMGIP